MEAYPQKVREQILIAYEEKLETAEIARTYHRRQHLKDKRDSYGITVR